MPSPFPGMDPYIENGELWFDFHNDLAVQLRAQLNRLIQPNSFARLAPSVTYDEIAAESLSPMAMVTSTPIENSIVLEVSLRTHWVEIRTTATQELITVIEILSPVNKRPGHEAHLDYLRKRRDILRSPVHLLEIDLLRGGERPPLERPVPSASYYVVLSRATRRPTVEVWPIQLADRLPVLPVPLLEPDPDVPLDLGAAVHSVYERGAYASQIDYRQPLPPPPLSETEATWLEELLREKGR